MRPKWPLRTLAILSLPVLMFSTPGAADDNGFVSIFDGKTLENWDGDPRLWRVEDGAITGETKDDDPIKHNSFLFTEKEYSDFVLRIKAKLGNHNSGIQFRSEQLDDYAVAGYQADIAEQTYFGMLYEEKKRGFMPYWQAMSDEARAQTQEWVNEGGWNQFEITGEGDHVQIKLNGHTTCDIVDPEGAKKGIIALQLHAGPEMEVRFKDIEIKDLSSDTQARLLSDIDRAE